MAAFGAQRLDAGAGGLRDPQPVQGEQGDQRVLGGLAQARGDQQGTEFVAVQAGGVRLVVQAGTADVGRRGMIEQVFLDGVPVEPGDGAQAAGDGGPGPAAGFQVAGEALDVGPPGSEQAQVAQLAPGGELAQVQGVGLTGQAGRPGTRPAPAALGG